MKRKRPGYFWALVDMFAAMLATYAALWILSLMQMHPAESKPGIEMKAEYVLMMTWPEGSLDDIDLHLLLPDNEMVNFNHREAQFAYLDRDDIGTNGIYFGSDGKPTRIPEHREIITLRSIVPGTYAVNVHVFRVNEQYAGFHSDTSLPYPVKVALFKVNPTMEQLAAVAVTMTHIGEQKTAFAFTIADGGAVSVDLDADVPFIKTLPSFGEQANDR